MLSSKDKETVVVPINKKQNASAAVAAGTNRSMFSSPLKSTQNTSNNSN